jgi:mannose-6-phosphate isomerase-like protein (cupin superfamily)
MFIRNLNDAVPFDTKDGSQIRSLLDLSCAPVWAQSLAEATLQPGASTARHRHSKTEEFYYVTQGRAMMELDAEKKEVGLGDAILIPAGCAHKITNIGTDLLKILCCCAPPYSHEDTELLEK